MVDLLEAVILEDGGSAARILARLRDEARRIHADATIIRCREVERSVCDLRWRDAFNACRALYQAVDSNGAAMLPARGRALLRGR